MIYVSGPAGGFANHVGWLIWSNSKNKSFLNVGFMSSNTYNSIKKEHWPEYQKYLKILELVDKNKILIKKSSLIDELEKHGLFNVSVDNPLDFIKNNIYTSNRSWHNWILVESQYVERLHEIVINHKLEIPINKNDFYIFCQIDEQKSYRHYLKLNSSLTKKSKQGFLDYTKKWNEQILKYQNYSNVLIIDNSVLVNNNLDQNYYNTLINFLNLNNDYDNANIIHNLWNNCHKKAEQDFLKEVIEVYSR